MLKPDPNAIDIFRDDRVLASAGRFEALAEHQTIDMRNHGGRITIHLVREHGHEAMFLRAVDIGNTRLVVFDLRNVCPCLREIVDHHPHDVPGIIRFTLRGTFETATEVMDSMLASPIDWLQVKSEVAA